MQRIGMVLACLFLLAGAGQVLAQKKRLKSKEELAGEKVYTDFKEALLYRRSVYVLNLERQKLTSIDPKISKLKNLQELYLGYNQLESLPAELFLLKNLQKLVLTGNKLRELPDGIGNLINLEILESRTEPVVQTAGNNCRVQ